MKTGSLESVRFGGGVLSRYSECISASSHVSLRGSFVPGACVVYSKDLPDLGVF